MIQLTRHITPWKGSTTVPLTPKEEKANTMHYMYLGNHLIIAQRSTRPHDPGKAWPVQCNIRVSGQARVVVPRPQEVP